MDKLSDLRAKAADAFATEEGRNWSFDLWRLKSRITAAAVKGFKYPIDLTDFKYWFTRPVV